MPLTEAIAWIDGIAAPLPEEVVDLAQAPGRVLVEPVESERDIPDVDRAAADGFAVRADETVGASAYNPLAFQLAPGSEPVPHGAAAAVQSGDPLPPGTDAVVRLELATPDRPDTIAVVVPVFAGCEVDRAGSHAARGTVLVAAGQRLDPYAIGLLAAAGIARVPVVGTPRVRCLLWADGLASPGHPLTPGQVYDANGPLLASLLARDGGAVADMRCIGRDRAALREALVMPGADIILVVGGTGAGPVDQAAAALSEAGEVAVHGVALRPGDSAGAGRVANVPVLLLPGSPAACLWAYEMLAGRAVRRLAGRSPELPHGRLTLRAARKIVSEVGTVEICPVRCTGDGEAEPLPSFAEAGLSAAVGADGFVIVPEASEGYPSGAEVTVYRVRSPA